MNRKKFARAIFFVILRKEENIAKCAIYIQYIRYMYIQYISTNKNVFLKEDMQQYLSALYKIIPKKIYGTNIFLIRLKFIV